MNFSPGPLLFLLLSMVVGASLVFDSEGVARRAFHAQMRRDPEASELVLNRRVVLAFGVLLIAIGAIGLLSWAATEIFGLQVRTLG